MWCIVVGRWGGERAGQMPGKDIHIQYLSCFVYAGLCIFTSGVNKRSEIRSTLVELTIILKR